MPGPSDPIFDAVLARYPFPIAFALKEAVLDAPDDERRVRGLIQTFTLGIQYAALVCAGEYARAGYRDEQLSWSLEGLKRPLVSHFASFVRAALKSMQQQAVEPLVAELPAFAARLDQAKVTVPVMVDGKPRDQSMPVPKALEQLRNTLAHHAFAADWPALAGRYLPHLATFLEALDWSARYPLLRLVGGGQMVRLMGAGTQFAAEPLPDAALAELARAQKEGELSGLLLADSGLGQFLGLHPLVVMETCPQCQAEPLRGLTEEVFLFNGDEGRHLVYLGVRHGWNTERHRDAVDALYERKKVAPPVVQVGRAEVRELRQRAARQAGRLLEINRKARRYLPAVYQPRPETDAALRAFLGSRRVGFCLLGEAGIGKTSLLCRKVEEWGGATQEAAGDVVLFYEGRGLFAAGGLAERVLADLYLAGSFPELLNRLRPTGRRLVLVIDGVNEDESPARTLQGVCEFVKRHASPLGGSAPPSPVKVVFSFRTAFFGKALQALGFKGDGDEATALFPADAFFTREVERQGRREETYQQPLGPMTVEEAGTLYETYRGFEGVKGATGEVRRFCPQTPFAELSPPAQQLLTHPWYLRMVLEAFDGRRVPASLWAGELLEEFCRAKIYGRSEGEQRLFADRAAFADELVALMRQHRTDTVERGDPRLSPRLERAMGERQLALSPYLQLVDEGVLLEAAETEASGRRTRTRYLVRFAFDALFEYLLSEDVLREAGGRELLTGERLAALLEKGKEFGHLTAAAELLLTESAQRAEHGLLTGVLDAGEHWTVAPVLVRVLLALDEMRHAGFEAALDAVARSRAGAAALTVFIDTSYHLGEKQRFRPALPCLDRAMALARRLVKDEGRAELANDLAKALVNKGNALQGLGGLAEAVACYDEAIAVRRRLVKDEGRAELANDLAKALVNKALLLEKQEQWQDALEHYEEAVRCQEACLAAGMTHLLPDLVRTLRYRIATLLDLGRWAEAADDVVRALDHAAPALQADPPEALLRERDALVETLRQRSDEEREQVLAALGKWAVVVNGWLDE
jgi:tetratricopeptide (TPR) repeat protein